MAGITIKEFEDKYHELFSDPKDEEIAAENLAEVEAEIEQHNKDYENGKSSYSEAVNENSILSQDELLSEKGGMIHLDSRYIGLGLITNPDRVLSPEEEEYLRHMYADIDRQTIPASYDARTLG